MQHYAGPEPKHIILECQDGVYAEEVLLSDQEEERCFEEDAVFDLQCAESLAIAANRIGEETFGVKQLLNRLLRSL